MIFDTTQEKLINNKKFFRITHSSQNNRRKISNINVSELQSLPKGYTTFFTNKSFYTCDNRKDGNISDNLLSKQEDKKRHLKYKKDLAHIEK